MQTFLPFSDFAKSARVLDRQRLGKQRVENMQIMDALMTGRQRNAVHHPATKMWKGYELALLRYQERVVTEWLDRGYKDTCLEKTETLYHGNRQGEECVMPPWLGDPEFHRAHQSTLLRKAHTMTDRQMKYAGIPRDFYDAIFPGVPDDIQIFYPAPKESP